MYILPLRLTTPLNLHLIPNIVYLQTYDKTTYTIAQAFINMEDTNREKNEYNIIEAIIKFNNDSEVQQLQSFYNNQTVPEILGVSRREISHSAFLAWLFNPNSNHSLGQKPLILLLERYLRCYREQGKEVEEGAVKLPIEIETAILTHNISITSTDVKTEEAIATNKAKGRADIVITSDVKIPNSNYQRLSIIIENKIYSNEHNNQTQTYFDYHDKNRLRDNNGSPIEFCLYIYLTPATIEKKAECPSFIHLTYQNLLDDVLERLLIQPDISERTKFILTEYINNLSLPADYIDEKNNTKKKIIMAISDKERELLKAFWEKHKELFRTALVAISSDENASEEEQEDARKILAQTENLIGKRYDRYNINGKGNYPCGRLVLELIKMYVQQHPNATLDEINVTFKDYTKQIAATMEEAINIHRKSGHKRHFIDSPVRLINDTPIAITNQWGNGKKLDNLIKYAETNINDCKVERIQ